MRSLIHHAYGVDQRAVLEEVRETFKVYDVDYLAVLRDGVVLGLCSRRRLGILMGSRFGYALHSQSTVEVALRSDPLIVMEGDPVRSVLARTFRREGEAFFEDVLLVDDRRRLIGLISTETLSKVQTQLVAEQLGEMAAQQRHLERQNEKLFAANDALQQSRGLYQGLFESNAMGVALLDRQGHVQSSNRRFRELFRLPATVLDPEFLFPSLLRAEDRAPFLSRLARYERHSGGELPPAAVEVRLGDEPGRARWIRVTLGWIVETGQVCACFEEITEQRALEDVVRRQEKQNLLDRLVGGIAHELNNKLTPVVGFAELLSQQSGSEWAHYTGPIQQSVKEAASMIKQLLQLSRPSRGDVRILDVRQVVEEAAPMLTFKLRDGKVKLVLAMPADPVTVRADAGHLKQIVINLVLNAVQALATRPDGCIEILAGQDGEQVWVHVRDNGPGIAAADLDRVFDPFFTTKGPDQGSGLGLSISTSLARQYGGTLSVASEPGDGATFRLSLPHAEAGEHLFVPEPPPAPAPVTESDESADKKTVLLVEDEEVLRGLLEEVLRGRFGCHIELADDGVDAWEILRERDFDLVVSDVRMPRMTGLELFERVQAERPQLVERFVFVSGHGGTGEGDVAKRLLRTNRPVLAKPFSLGQLETLCGPMLGHG